MAGEAATARDLTGGSRTDTTIHTQPLPALIREQSHEPLDAIALIFAMLLSDDPAVQKKQRSFIQLSEFPKIDHMVLRSLTATQTLDAMLFIPTVEMSLPALKSMSAPQYRSFCKTLLLLIRADGRTDLNEWCQYQLIRHYLDAEYGINKNSRPKYKTAEKVAEQYQLVLSLLAHQGNDDPVERDKAFHRGANTAGLYTLSLVKDDGFNMESFIQAINSLADCYPLLKPKLLKGLSDCAKQDGVINAEEAQLITAIAAVMDCPTPALEI